MSRRGRRARYGAVIQLDLGSVARGRHARARALMAAYAAAVHIADGGRGGCVVVDGTRLIRTDGGDEPVFCGRRVSDPDGHRRVCCLRMLGHGGACRDDFEDWA